MPNLEGLKNKKSRRIVNQQQASEKQPLCEVNEKLPKQVKYQIRPSNTSLITACAQFNGDEYEGRGFTQREAKNEAAAALLKANPHLKQTQGPRGFDFTIICDRSKLDKLKAISWT